jgi:class 3 adenylate cyclase
MYALLDEGWRHPERMEQAHAEVWRQAGAERAVLVTDLDGFTKITKEEGILHFLSTFRRAVGIAAPVLERHGSIFWKSAADDLIATFPDVDGAVAAAVDLAGEAVDGVRFCVGVGYGPVLQLDDDVFGDEVNMAFKLGEEVSGAGEVLLSEKAAAHYDGDLDGPHTVFMSHLTLVYYRRLV